MEKEVFKNPEGSILVLYSLIENTRLELKEVNELEHNFTLGAGKMGKFYVLNERVIFAVPDPKRPKVPLRCYSPIFGRGKVNNFLDYSELNPVIGQKMWNNVLRQAEAANCVHVYE